MLFPLARFKIKNHSMHPTFQEGDEVLIWKFSKVKKGDVVVFKYKSKYLIKRLSKIKKEEIFVKGDNKEDSLKIDSIRKKDILGKVICKF